MLEPRTELDSSAHVRAARHVSQTFAAAEAESSDESRQNRPHDRRSPSPIEQAASPGGLFIAAPSSSRHTAVLTPPTATPPPSATDTGPTASPRTLWLEQPVERGRTPISTSSHHRSTSVPSKPLKSALATSPPGTTSTALDPSLSSSRKKKVNFSDEGALKRSETAPAAVGWVGGAEVGKREFVAEREAQVEFEGRGGAGVWDFEADSDLRSGSVEDETVDVAMEEPGSDEVGVSGSLPHSRSSSPWGPLSSGVDAVDPQGCFTNISDSSSDDEQLDDDLPPLEPEDERVLSDTDSSISDEVLLPPDTHEREVLETYHRMHEVEKRRFSVEEREELRLWSASGRRSPLEEGQIEEDTEQSPEISADDEAMRPTLKPDQTPFSNDQGSQRLQSASTGLVKRPSYPSSHHRTYGGSRQGSETPTKQVRHAVSTSDFFFPGDKSMSSPRNAKASPAHCALTAMSISRVRSPSSSFSHERIPQTTVHTVRSPNSIYQMLWEEAADDEDGEGGPVGLEDPDSTETAAEDDEIVPDTSRGSSPMSHARTKLAAWSWACEQAQSSVDDDEDGETPRWMPLMAVDDRSRRCSSQATEGPMAPPNTTRGSSAFHSVLHTPMPEDEEDPPMEMHSRPFLTLADRPHSDYLTCTRPSPHSIPVSPLGTQYPHFHSLTPPAYWSRAAHETSRFHRDSVELSRRHLDDQAKLNAKLMTTNDSFLLTRSRYPYGGAGIHPLSKSTATLGLGSRGAGTGIVGEGWTRTGGLSTIVDASPPSERVASLGLRPTGVGAVNDHDRPSWTPADEHTGCAIYDVERPRWFEAKYQRHSVFTAGRGMGGSPCS
nr:hypothetical protein CFP56_62866 [Quercus suber]